MPPFYIGRSSVKRVREGYHGSVSSAKYKKIWRAEIEQHPELFKTKILGLFSSVEDASAAEAKLHDHLDVRRHPLHINAANASMRFYQDGPLPEHVKENLRRIKTGKKMSEATKEKMRSLVRSEETRSKIGDANRRRQPISEETRRKLAEAKKNESEAVKQKRSASATARWERYRNLKAGAEMPSLCYNQS